VETSRIAALLAPFLPPSSASQTDTLFGDILIYINILLKWNARLNLTAVREPDEIVTRHFGESLFAAAHLFPERDTRVSLADLGSGAGFPGLPIKLWAPDIHLNLIEAGNKKATFLREAARALRLKDVEVYGGRAENFLRKTEVVTMRAVEKFDLALPLAAKLAVPGGRLALLIGSDQLRRAGELVPHISWESPLPIPHSRTRVLVVGVAS
jgi:16S rRNA (guanine527-N7)-methyltransferase